MTAQQTQMELEAKGWVFTQNGAMTPGYVKNFNEAARRKYYSRFRNSGQTARPSTKPIGRTGTKPAPDNSRNRELKREANRAMAKGAGAGRKSK